MLVGNELVFECERTLIQSEPDSLKDSKGYKNILYCDIRTSKVTNMVQDVMSYIKTESTEGVDYTWAMNRHYLIKVAKTVSQTLP
jgi:hypothetical protein